MNTDQRSADDRPRVPDAVDRPSIPSRKPAIQEQMALDKGDLDKERVAWNDSFTLQVKAEKQKIFLRWIVVCLSVIALVLLVVLEVFVLCKILETPRPKGQSWVVLAISPIVAVTTIIVFLIIGVFRNFRETDMNKFPVGTAARNMTGGLQP